MARLLCFLGIHAWREVYRRLSWWNERCSVHRVRWHCKRCKKVFEFYDTGE